LAAARSCCPAPSLPWWSTAASSCRWLDAFAGVGCAGPQPGRGAPGLSAPRSDFALVLSGSVARAIQRIQFSVLAVALVALTAGDAGPRCWCWAPRARWVTHGAASLTMRWRRWATACVARLFLGRRWRLVSASAAPVGTRVAQCFGQGFRPERSLASLWQRGGSLKRHGQPVCTGRPGFAVRGLAAFRGGRPARRLAILSLFFVVLALGTFTPIYGLYRKLVWPEHCCATQKSTCCGVAAVGGAGWRGL